MSALLELAADSHCTAVAEGAVETQFTPNLQHKLFRHIVGTACRVRTP